MFVQPERKDVEAAMVKLYKRFPPPALDTRKLLPNVEELIAEVGKLRIDMKAEVRRRYREAYPPAGLVIRAIHTEIDLKRTPLDVYVMLIDAEVRKHINRANKNRRWES